MGKAKTVFNFFVGDEGTVISFIVNGIIEDKFFCTDTNSDGMVKLTELLKEHPNAPTSILLDSIDQSYQSQSFPPVAKLSVQKLVDARLKRDFAPGDITAALPLGKEKTGRNDWKFLLISVVTSPQLMQWIDFILELPNPFDGLFLVPVEAENIIKKITPQKKKGESGAMWHMLVLHNKVSGFRQIITKGGRLVFTRLTQPSPGENVPLVIAGNIEQEVSSTVEYLKRLSYREDEGLDITVISSPEIIEAIDDTKIGNHSEAKLLNPSAAAELLKLSVSNFTDNHFADLISASFFANNSKRVLPLNTELGKKLNTMKMGLKIAKYGTLAISSLLVLGMLYCAYLWYDSFSQEPQIEQNIKTSRAEAAELKDIIKVPREDLEKIQDTLDVHEKFAIQPQHPLSFVKKLSAVEAQNIIATRISWDSANSFTDRLKSDEEKVKMRLEVKFGGEASDAEKRVESINKYITALRIAFPEYKLTMTPIAGTLNEGDSLALDYTNSDSQQLAYIPILTTITFTLAPPKTEGNS